MPHQSGNQLDRSAVRLWRADRSPAAYVQALRNWGATVEDAPAGHSSTPDRRRFFIQYGSGPLVVASTGPLPTSAQTAGTGLLWLLQPSAAWLESPACPKRLLASTAALPHGLRLMDIRAQAAGPVSLCIDLVAPADAGNFTIGLADALNLVRCVAGPIESVAASICSGSDPGTLPTEPLPALAALGAGGGDLVARIACEDGSIAAVRVSVGGSWRRAVSLSGAGGHVELCRGVLEWRGTDGQLIERVEGPGASLDEAVAATFEVDAPLVDCAVLAIDCEAACLSAITGDVERPARMRAALGVTSTDQAAMISPIFTRK